MQDRYTLFIDESGEAGIERIRSSSSGGASPYMTLGACLIPNDRLDFYRALVGNVRADIGKPTLHCSKLRHYEIVHFARSVVKDKIRMFGVISKKSTLGTYRSDIEGDSSKYYNKCSQYLLERVGWFLESREINAENVDIIFEEANIDYEKMKNLLRACQRNPRWKNTEKIKNISVDKITTKKKTEECLLEIADLVAHSIYKCVDKYEKNFGIPELRYVRELSGRFFGHPETKIVVGAGLYCVHSIENIELDADVKEIVAGLKAD